MKSLLCLFLFVFSAVPAFPAMAADDLPVRGAVGQAKKILPLTPEQIDEAFKVSDDCKAYGYMRQHYDCDCLGMNFLELRRKEGYGASAFSLKEMAKQKCPNTPEIAGTVYTRCLTWAPAERGEGYESFCTCYGSEFAKLYAKNPSDNQLIREYQMTRAMTACHIGSINQKRHEQEKLIQRLKKDGIYDKLLPGAAMSEDLTNRSEPPPEKEEKK